MHVYVFIPFRAISELLCANSIRFKSSFSDSILCIVPRYSDRVRSTESRISLTVALKISFRDDSSKTFKSLDLAIASQPVGNPNKLPRWFVHG